MRLLMGRAACGYAQMTESGFEPEECIGCRTTETQAKTKEALATTNLRRGLESDPEL